MLSRQIPIDQTAPWLISGVAGCYIVARTRQLSQAKASRATWLRFLAQQSDVILMLCGGPAIWHFVRRRSIARVRQTLTNGDRADLTSEIAHQLRQVFTVLLLGLGMLARKAPDRKTAELISLVQRLQTVTRTGARLLTALDTPVAEPQLLAIEVNGSHLPANGR